MWDDLELIGTTNEKDTLPISSQIICQKLCNGNHLALIQSLKNTDVHLTSLRSRRLEVVGARENERARGRHARGHLNRAWYAG